MTERQKRIVATLVFWIFVGGLFTLLWFAISGGMGSCAGQSWSC